MTESELIAKLIAGSTTKADELKIHFLGEYVALVGKKGGFYSDNGGKHYAQSHIDIYYLKRNYRSGLGYDRKELHEGRYSQARLQELIQQAKQAEIDEPAYISAVAAAKRDEANTEANEKRLCNERMETIRLVLSEQAKKIEISKPNRVFGIGQGKIYGSMDIVLKNGFRFGIQVHTDKAILGGIQAPPDADIFSTLRALADIHLE